MSFNIKLLENFINKYRNTCTIEIILIRKLLASNIYEIDLTNDIYEKISKTLQSKITPVKQTVQRYYHTDKYIEVTNTGLEYKKENIVDKLEINNMIIIAKNIENISADSIPGLNEYDNDICYNDCIYTIDGVKIILRECKTKDNTTSYNCILHTQNGSISTINNILTSYIF